jgi:hypothetical protein
MMLGFRRRSAKYKARRVAPRPKRRSVTRRFEYDDDDWEPEVGQPDERAEAAQGPVSALKSQTPRRPAPRGPGRFDSWLGLLELFG